MRIGPISLDQITSEATENRRNSYATGFFSAVVFWLEFLFNQMFLVFFLFWKRVYISTYFAITPLRDKKSWLLEDIMTIKVFPMIHRPVKVANWSKSTFAQFHMYTRIDMHLCWFFRSIRSIFRPHHKQIVFVIFFSFCEIITSVCLCLCESWRVIFIVFN